MIQSDHSAEKRMRRRRGGANRLITADATPGKGPRCANFYVASGTFVGILTITSLLNFSIRFYQRNSKCLSGASAANLRPPSPVAFGRTRIRFRRVWRFCPT